MGRGRNLIRIGVMAGEGVELRALSGFNGTTATLIELLDVVHFNYTWVLFLVFVIAFVANTILSFERSSESTQPILLGPGGKPLPRSLARKNKEEREKKKKLQDFSPSKKLLFLYLSAALLATFLANGINIVIRALTKSENGWWCGEPMAVSGNSEYTIGKLV